MASPLMILVGADKGGVGKRQPLTSGILTPSGWRTMGEMKVGTPICGTDGRAYRVSGVFPQGSGTVYRMTFTDGTFADSGGEHLWKVINIFNGKRDGWRVKTTDELRSLTLSRPGKGGKIYCYRIPMIEAIQFASAEVPIAPYALGALIGDGCLGSSTISLSAPPAKLAIQEKVASVLGSQHRMTGPHVPGTSQRWNILCCGNDESIKFKLEKLGLDVKSKERFIPEIYKTASISDRLELLRGLMDTDGSTRNRRTSYSSCSERLAMDLADIVRSLGGIAVVHRYDRSKEGKSAEWNVNVRMKVCPFSLEYKAANWRPAAQNFGKYIKSIDAIGEAEMQCISVAAPDRLYITDGFNATHNTTVTAALRDYMESPAMQALPRPRLLDGQYPRGDLAARYPDAQVVNVTDVLDQMRIFDGLEGVTIVDLPAGVLGFMLRACDEAQLLDDVRDGRIRMALLHVLGPTVSSMDEIGEATQLLGTAAKHFVVKNHINETNFFEWDQDSRYAKSLQALENVTIDIPHLKTIAAEAIQQSGGGFVEFIKPGLDASGRPKSRTLRGIAANWLARCASGFDKVGLGRMIEETYR